MVTVLFSALQSSGTIVGRPGTVNNKHRKLDYTKMWMHEGGSKVLVGVPFLKLDVTVLCKKTLKTSRNESWTRYNIYAIICCMCVNSFNELDAHAPPPFPETNSANRMWKKLLIHTKNLKYMLVMCVWIEAILSFHHCSHTFVNVGYVNHQFVFPGKQFIQYTSLIGAFLNFRMQNVYVIARKYFFCLRLIAINTLSIEGGGI